MPILSAVGDFLTQYLYFVSAFLPGWQVLPFKLGNLDGMEKIDKYLENSIQSRVAYRSDYSNEKFPYFASLKHCGAAVISDQWVLTAAHCVNGVHLVDEFVSVGAENYENGVKIPIDTVVLHPWFVDFEDVLLNDIALVKLTKPINSNNNVNSIAIGDYDNYWYHHESPLFLVGRGLSEKENVTVMDITVAPTEVCYATSYSQFYWYLSPFTPLLDIMTMCGVSFGYSPNAGSGEGSGSLLVSDDELIGIFSHGFGIHRKETSRVIFFTKIASYVPWIDSVIGPDHN